MLKEDRNCSEIILQVMVVRRALDNDGVTLFTDHLDRWLPSEGAIVECAEFEQLRSGLELWDR